MPDGGYRQAKLVPVAYSDELFRPLIDEAPDEGGAFLLRLRQEWNDAMMRFDAAGELLLGAFIEDRLVGVAGISHDPYNPAAGLGRVRHLYVLKQLRGRGIGRALMDRLLVHARTHFSVLRLTTQAPEAARLYESFGFRRSVGPKETHRLEF